MWFITNLENETVGYGAKKKTALLTKNVNPSGFYPMREGPQRAGE